MRRAVCFDIGGVLLPDYLRPAAAQWGQRLGCGERSFLEALFAGSDDQVLTGRQDEASWWRVVAGRLRASEDLIAELRRDLAARQRWDPDLVALVRGLRGRAALGRLGVAPGDALFVDDTPGHVAAAEALGMAGHVHTDATSTIARIEAFATGACCPPTPSP